MLDLRYLGGAREFYATEDEAKTARRVKLEAVREHGAAALALSNDERIDFVRAREALKPFNATISDAVEFFKKHHAITQTVSFADAIKQASEIKRATNKDPEYVRKFEANLKSLCVECGDKPLSQVSRDDVEKWLFKNGWSPATIRGKRIDVRTFFRFAVGRRWIVSNPAEKLEAVQLPDAPPGILKVDECKAMLSVIDENLLPLVVLNLFCGLRPEECVQIRNENVQLDRGFVEVLATVAKSRKRRIVEISQNARVWLLNIKFVPRTPKWYARQLPKLRKLAGQVLGRPFPWPKNCLRHSFASYHLAMHGSADKTALQMGHRSTDMLFRHYRELVTKEEAEKFWVIVP